MNTPAKCKSLQRDRATLAHPELYTVVTKLPGEAPTVRRFRDAATAMREVDRTRFSYIIPPGSKDHTE